MELVKNTGDPKPWFLPSGAVPPISNFLLETMSQVYPSRESNGRASVFCAGLPFVGRRNISHDEKEMLKQELRSDSTYTVVWLLLAGLSIFVPVSIAVGLSLFITFSPTTEYVLAVLTLAVSLVSFTISLIRADRAFRRFRIAKRTLLEGRFRVFTGNFESEDPTDQERERLVENGILELGQTEPITLELHAVDDVIFAKNGSRLRKWVAVELTLAAPIPQQAARFQVPSEWQLPIEGNFQRRRMTLTEKQELLEYAHQIRRWRWLQIFLGIWAVASLIRIIAALTGLQTETAIQLWVLLAIAGSGLWFYWQGSKARSFEEDAELGWTVVANPEYANAVLKTEGTFTADIEFLPISNLVWIVKAKPAGWRRRKKAPLNQEDEHDSN